jgi:hypothetical protein
MKPATPTVDEWNRDLSPTETSAHQFGARITSGLPTTCAERHVLTARSIEEGGRVIDENTRG